MTTEQAATLMGVSARHTRRILAAYRRDGAAALAHGNRGRRPANATSDPLATDVVVLARTRYAGVNHTHLSELLREREGIDIGRNTLRKILTDAGMNSPRRRRPPKHRVRRQRMTREGMLIQIDGSYHRWLGEDGPQFTLLLAVDDATGCVVNALFCEQENTRSYLVTISKWPDATVAGTTGAHMRAVTHRGSSLPSCRTGPGPHGTWRAMPASVPQPTGAPDTACRQRRPASPRRCVGCAPYSRVRRQPHGLKDCHTLCPDTGVGVPPRWAVVVRPQWRPGSPPTAWHRARLLPQPQCSRGRPLHPQGDCAWYQPCHGP